MTAVFDMFDFQAELKVNEGIKCQTSNMQMLEKNLHNPIFGYKLTKKFGNMRNKS